MAVFILGYMFSAIPHGFTGIGVPWTITNVPNSGLVSGYFINRHEPWPRPNTVLLPFRWVSVPGLSIIRMNTDYAHIRTWKTTLFGRSQCSMHYICFLSSYKGHCPEHWLRPDKNLKTALFGRSQCSWHYIKCYNDHWHGWAWTLTPPR